ncbi:MAG: hypothetical protein ICV83_05425 [Cytophagales bacterium]|nr:hypothetical protein [Cytophagales bacterium]
MSSYFSQIASRASQTAGPALRPGLDFNPAGPPADGTRPGEKEEAADPFAPAQAPGGLIVPTPVPFPTGSNDPAGSRFEKHQASERPGAPVGPARYFPSHVERSGTPVEPRPVQPSATRYAPERPVTTAGNPDPPTDGTSREKNAPMRPEPGDRAPQKTDRHSPGSEDAILKPQPAFAVGEEAGRPRRKPLEPAAGQEGGPGNGTHPAAVPLRPPPEPAQSPDAGGKKSNRPVPSLVIGKITVEVLPAENPGKPKVVTRVVQATPAPQRAKPSKLSFGLGQL